MKEQKVIQQLQKASKDFNTSLENCINWLDIDHDKFHQEFYVFFGGSKYVLRVDKVAHQYQYNIKLLLQATKVLYTRMFEGDMCFDIHTGKAKITKVLSNKFMN